MHIPDPLYKALIDYLARKPWHEVNTLITALVQANTSQKQVPEKTGNGKPEKER